MDVLLAAVANTPARRAMNTGHHPATPADEDAYYIRHTLTATFPDWMVNLVVLIHRSHRAAPHHAHTTRHA